MPNHLLIIVLFTLIASGCSTIDKPRTSKRISHPPVQTTQKTPTTTQQPKLRLQHTLPSRWTSTVQDVLIHAISLKGTPYRYGGNTPRTGFDCSGFVRYVFNQASSVRLPRTTRDISRRGRHINKSNLQVGDLVFFNTQRRAFSHVGIFMGNNKFIHSPSSGGVVREDSMNNPYWRKRYNGAKRLDTESR